MARGVDVKLVLPGPIDTEIWEQQPGELPGLYDGPFVTAADCAADIVRGDRERRLRVLRAGRGPGRLGDQKDIVVGKTQNCDAFVELLVAMKPPEG